MSTETRKRKRRIAYQLAEELRRLALLVSLCGFGEVVERRIQRLEKIIEYYRVNK